MALLGAATGDAGGVSRDEFETRMNGAAMLCATLVNVNRDPRKVRPAKPEEFNPYRRRKQQCIQMDRAETMSFLREFAQGAAR